MEQLSLGLIETRGLLPAIEAADAAAKAADVEVLGYEQVRAGLVTVKLIGDVAAVSTAVHAGAAAAGKVGKVVSTHVIARPDRQLQTIQWLRVPKKCNSEQQQEEESRHEQIESAPDHEEADHQKVNQASAIEETADMAVAVAADEEIEVARDEIKDEIKDGPVVTLPGAAERRARSRKMKAKNKQF